MNLVRILYFTLLVLSPSGLVAENNLGKVSFDQSCVIELMKKIFQIKGKPSKYLPRKKGLIIFINVGK